VRYTLINYNRPHSQFARAYLVANETCSATVCDVCNETLSTERVIIDRIAPERSANTVRTLQEAEENAVAIGTFFRTTKLGHKRTVYSYYLT